LASELKGDRHGGLAELRLLWLFERHRHGDAELLGEMAFKGLLDALFDELKTG